MVADFWQLLEEELPERTSGNAAVSNLLVDPVITLLIFAISSDSVAFGLTEKALNLLNVFDYLTSFLREPNSFVLIDH